MWYGFGMFKNKFYEIIIVSYYKNLSQQRRVTYKVAHCFSTDAILGNRGICDL